LVSAMALKQLGNVRGARKRLGQWKKLISCAKSLMKMLII
jgi:hypothetical protein